MRFNKFFIAASICLTITGCANTSKVEATSAQSENPWSLAGRLAVENRIAVKANNNKAKNVILFIGDGLGISTVTAARIFDGQSKGMQGEENSLSFESFPNLALVKTYNTDSQVPDSAATASAMNTGVKTRFQSVGIWGDQPAQDCVGTGTDFPMTLAEIGESKGIATGIVTTDKVTYATPAAVYAHAPHRSWEDDTKLPEWAVDKGCHDIAQQLVEFKYGDGIDVILGGGSESLLPKNKGGLRQDGRDLIREWKDKNDNGEFVSNASQLRKISKQNLPSKLMGIFSRHHMSYSADKDIGAEPTLSEMTAAAIDVLSKDNEGYFLMVENGHIDHGHHKNNAYRALTDTQEFSKAVSTALSKVDLSNTLILVTADHSHPFTISGYPKRGNPILGHVIPISSKDDDLISNDRSLDQHGAPFTTLGYRAGTNPRVTVPTDMTKDEHLDLNYIQESAISRSEGFHAGEDVALYAIGAQSHLVGGVLEQNVIFHIIAHALSLN